MAEGPHIGVPLCQSSKQQNDPNNGYLLIFEIDRVLAKHYGFTGEELDFIINYDIKYRMGQDAGADDDS
jgi:hypothetical protein